jgi:hypothetical protein
MIADQIPKKEKELFLPDSFFRVVFTDDSSVSEHDVDWVDMSELRTIGRYQVRVCVYPVKRIEISHAGLLDVIEPGSDEIYQMVKARANLTPSGSSAKIIGRIVGRIRDGKIVEEHYLDAERSEIIKTMNPSI